MSRPRARAWLDSSSGDLMRRSFRSGAGSISVIPMPLIQNRRSVRSAPGTGSPRAGRSRPPAARHVEDRQARGSDGDDSWSPSRRDEDQGYGNRGDQRSAAASNGRRGRRRAAPAPGRARVGSARSSDGSCSRIARSSRRSGGPGSSRARAQRDEAAVRVERLRLPAAAVEREHQQAEQVLAVGMSRDQPFELTDDLVAAEGELASIRASVAESTSSSSCATSDPAHDSSRRSASGPPRTSSNAARSCPAPRPAAP